MLQLHSASDHPLSVQNLQTLVPGVPHTFNSRSTSPYFNLAVEHHLLTHSHPASRILFTYANTPCVVIGRNQNPWVECNIAAIAQGTPDGRQVELIRRRSGGGTVFHDEGNLNYTVIVPGERFERKTHVQMVVDALVALRDKQYVFRRWDQVKANERNDIVARLSDKYSAEGAEEEWFKVSGTAFKLTKGRALHHGTLLHSSPYIDSIGRFLRSPVKDYITAKGVESVRSPVTNLWDVKKARQRRDLTFSVRKTIERMWVEKYADESIGPPNSIEVASGQPEDLIPELKAGIQELRTKAWRWDQTPGFSFDSKEIVMGGQSLRLGFEVKNGVIESVKSSEELQPSFEQLLIGKKIHELSAPGKWRELPVDEKLSKVIQDALKQLVETCFPPLENKDRTGDSKQLMDRKTQANSSAEAQQSGTKRAKRKSKDGVVRLGEQDSNAVADNNTQHIPRGGYYLRSDDVRNIRHLDIAVARLSKRLAKWFAHRKRLSMIREDVKPVTGAENKTGRTGKIWSYLAFDDLAAITRQVNDSMFEVRLLTSELLEISRDQARQNLYQPLHAKTEDVSCEIRDLSLQLTSILTRKLIEERKKASRGSARVGLYDDDDDDGLNEQKDSDSVRKMSPEGTSNAQRILEATLAMIDQEDRQSHSTSS